MVINVATFLCLAGPVLASLECTDWQGNTFQHGDELSPNKDDPCHKCLCDDGSLTMCKTVSCAPPNCPHLRKIPGKCCEFQCLSDTYENTTGVPPLDRDNQGTPSNATMTDLGLRLVASTVTTFLILALLLFLIHRLRQRRLLLTLRRYSRRREPLDDSDDMSYSPELFGIHCPPYEDPPPPYSPPKPPHFRLGEQPPPYEAIDSNANHAHPDVSTNSNTNLQSTNRSNPANGSIGANNGGLNSGQGGSVGNNTQFTNLNEGFQNSRTVSNEGNRIENIELVQRINSHSRGRNENERNSFHGNQRSVPGFDGVGDQNDSGMALNSLNVHFRNSLVGLPSITMGVQNRGRFNRHRFSDGHFHAHRNFNVNPGLNLEIRHSMHNSERNAESQNRHSFVNTYGEHSSSTTDIGESTTSAESLPSSPDLSPESPALESESQGQPSPQRKAEPFPDDADLTVRQFLDRQFGRGSKSRRYPTTMSQSWTSTQLNTSTMPNVRQSVSIGSFQPAHFDEAEQPKAGGSPGGIADRQRFNKKLPRSKSEHLKTNGSLRSQPYKGTVRTQPTFLPHTGFAARVSYVDPDDVSGGLEGRSLIDNANNNQSLPISSHANRSVLDSNLSECSVSLNSSHPHSRIDPGDIIVTRRQDDLRELRLSHLLHNPGNLTRSMTSASGREGGVVPLHRSHSLNSVTSVCSETGEKSVGGVALSNDAQYPVTALGSMQGSQSTPTKNAKKNNKNLTFSDSATDINGNTNSISSESTQETYLKDESQSNATDSSPGCSQQANNTPNRRQMSTSWHGGVLESSDENTGTLTPRTDTLGRNVNTNFAKKTCADKDVSNLCFPLFKPTNFDVRHANDVPSSGMRACASQLYNLEAEENFLRKDKKKHFLKRHSASCFPAKRDPPGPSSHSPSRLTNKLKNSFSKDRQTSERTGESVSFDSPRKSSGKKSYRRDRKSSSAERPTVRKARPYFDGTNGVVTDLTPACLIHANLAPPVSKIDSKVRHSEGASGDTNTSRQCSSRSAKRSKSLGRSENVRHSGSDKKVELCPNHRSQNRKKKCHSCQSFPGTQLFHQELEHILEKQKGAIKSSMNGTKEHSMTRV